MGYWGNLPWENDAAADWFGELFDTTQLAEKVRETLHLDVEDAHEEIRAAASVVLMLCHNFAWPVEEIDKDLKLAASRLEELMQLEPYKEDPDLLATLQAEVRVLRGRISSSGPSDKVQWWRF